MRVFESLLGGRFRLTKVVRIDHKDDGNEVANKIYDYSHMTIENLMKDGYRDALESIENVEKGLSLKEEKASLIATAK